MSHSPVAFARACDCVVSFLTYGFLAHYLQGPGVGKRALRVCVFFWGGGGVGEACVTLQTVTRDV